MRILWKKLREGKVKVQVDTLEDLWYLSNLISAGDSVLSRTFRRMEEKDKKRASRGEKKAVNIKLKVEDVEFHKSSNRLRIGGVIEAGTPEEYIDFGSHHTINLELGGELVIQKMWTRPILKILEECEKKRPKLVILAVDRGEAVFGLVKDYGIEYSSMRKAIPGKDQPEKIPEAEKLFYSEVAESLGRYEFEKCVICGSGFWKDDFFKVLKEKKPELAGKCIPEHTGASGENAIAEVLKKGIVHKLIKESKLAEEAELMEKLLAEIAKGGKCTYGVEQVKNAVQLGAVEELLITDELLRSGKMVSILQLAEKNKGRIVIISSEHETGKQLESLSGIAAMLRYRIE